MVKFEALEIGDIINYDLELRTKKLVNRTALILDKNDNCVKLHENNITWYCTKPQYTQLQNVVIVATD